MGFLDSVRGLFAPQRSLVDSSPAAPPVEADGIAGGANFSGRVVGFEPNADLRDVSGYGRAGTYEVGEWAQAALSNPWVTMAMDHVLRPVAAARVDVTPAKGNISEADAKKHADFITWALTEHFDLGSLNKAAASGALLSGFSLFEPLAIQVDYQGAPHWGLSDVRQCLPNSLDPSSPWQVDGNGRLVGIGQMGPVGSSGRWVRTVLPADRALLFSHKREAGNFAGMSQLRSCWYTACRAMPRLLKMVPVTLQREGPGVPVAVSQDKDSKLTPAQRVELVELFANMPAHESSGVVMPTGWKMDWVVSPAANKGHIVDVIERMGLWVLQQFGAQQLVIGTGTTGALSSSETHDARSMAMVVEVLRLLSRVYNGARGEADGLVKRLIVWNFGPQSAYPKVTLTPQRPELGPAELSTSAKAAKEAGLFTPTIKDENSYRERAGFSPITQEELDAERAAAAARAPQFSPFGQPSLPPGSPKQEAEEDPEGEPKSEEVEVPDEKPLKASAPRAWTPWRPLRASEEKLKLADMDAFFTAQRERFEALVRPVVVGMLGMAAPAIERAMADGTVTPEEVAAIPLDDARLDRVLAEYLQHVRKTGGNFVRGELEAGPLTAAAGDGGAGADKVVDAQRAALRRRMLNRLRGEVEREAIDVLRTGGTAAEVVTRTIARQLDTGAFKSDAGSVTTKVFNLGRNEAAQLIGGVASVEYSALLDSATCESCVAMDGRTAAFDSPEHDAILPPNRDCAGGDACRCLLTFIPGKPGEESE